MTDYATGTRYPGWGEISLAEARRAVAATRRVRKEIRKQLRRKRSGESENKDHHTPPRPLSWNPSSNRPPSPEEIRLRTF